MTHHDTLPGFTIVETLVAIAVLMFAVVGPFFIIEGVLQSSYIARDQLIATALAQEGMEYVYGVRDGNFLYNLHNSGNRSWLNGLDGSNGPNCYPASNGTGFPCVVDPTTLSNPVIACANATCSTMPLYLAASSLYNQQKSGAVTRFTRTMKLVQISANETQVIVTVSWSEHGNHSVTLSENLQNWL